MNKPKHICDLCSLGMPESELCYVGVHKCKKNGVYTCFRNREAEEKDKVLQELINIATPQKPCLWGDGYDEKGELIYDMYDCPSCGKSYELDYNKTMRCDNCGQVYDWEEE